jgi:hypothetical protein
MRCLNHLNPIPILKNVDFTDPQIEIREITERSVGSGRDQDDLVVTRLDPRTMSDTRGTRNSRSRQTVSRARAQPITERAFYGQPITERAL